MNCCNDYGDCTGGHNCPARATTLVDASRKALAVLSLTGADPAIQDELVGAMAEPDRIAELTAQLEAGMAVWRHDVRRIAELSAQRDELLAALNLLKAADFGANVRTAEDEAHMDRIAAFARSVIAKHQPTAAPAAHES